MYLDRTTGHGFLVDWEHSTHVSSPGDYVPFCASVVSYTIAFSPGVLTPFTWKRGLDKWGKSRQEIMEKIATMNAGEQQAQAEVDPEAFPADQNAKGEARSATPYVHAYQP
jgi:hypothetical protein